MTKADIMEELDALGVEYDSKARKAELEDALEEAKKPEVVKVIEEALEKEEKKHGMFSTKVAVDHPQPRKTPGWQNVHKKDFNPKPLYGWQGEQLNKNKLQ